MNSGDSSFAVVVSRNFLSGKCRFGARHDINVDSQREIDGLMRWPLTSVQVDQNSIGDTILLCGQMTDHHVKFGGFEKLPSNRFL